MLTYTFFVEWLGSLYDCHHARAAGGVAGFEGFCVRDGLLVAEGTGEGDPPHAVTTLYVGNLAPLVDEYVLMATFQFFGQITNIQARWRNPNPYAALTPETLKR